ncbi:MULTISPECIES: hypothetical protein [unclassified Sphingomonas]|uniref:hypothetical protein n=1 Tax=unclassified Sphingomonas TaxID=196159 RepID=UPI001E610AC9|nr:MULTISPECIES: hypothetical protein [unclassified Sphingomonas]
MIPTLPDTAPYRAIASACGPPIVRLPRSGHAPTSRQMPEERTAVDRIDAAIARIEAAIDARAHAGDALARRHAALKARMAEAVSALDEVISRGTAG